VKRRRAIRLFKFHLWRAAFVECSARHRHRFGIQKYTGHDHYRVVAFEDDEDDTHHGAVKFMVGSQMIQRNTGYPVKMAALVICHVSLLAALVWMFQ
jgi:hypothetical protein